MSLLHTSASTYGKVGPGGRYAGSVAGRPWPVANVDADAPTRTLLARTWLAQASTEACVADSFARVHRALVALRAGDEICALAKRAVDDEHRHAALCEELAGRYAGRCVGPYPAHTPPRPRHDEASPLMREVLVIVGQCCLNETFASAYLSCAKEGVKETLPTFALRQLLADEIDHARIGWSFLRTMPSHVRDELSRWLLPLAVTNLREWRKLELPDDDSLAHHGVPPMPEVRAALLEVLEGVMLPGFAEMGLRVDALETWIRQGAPDLHAPI